MSDNPDTSRRDAIREARREIIRSFFLALAALGAIVFSCYAWFVSSTAVSASGMSAAIRGNVFELVSVGSAGAFDEKLTDRTEGAVWEENNAGRITENSGTILWRVSDTSHLGNTTGSTGIEPGSSGTLQFYVIPKSTDPMNLKLSLEFIPMDLKNNTENGMFEKTVKDFLKGHILVRYRLGEEENSTLIDPLEGSFSLTVGPQPVLVSLDWSWSFLLENAIAAPVIKEEVSSHPQYFLCDDNDNPVTGTIELPEKNSQEFRQYSNFYNNADQYIGDHAGAIRLRLTVKE